MNTDGYVRFKNPNVEDPSTEERSLISLKTTVKRSNRECTKCSKLNIERRRFFILIIVLIVVFIVSTPIIIWLTVHFCQKEIESPMRNEGTNNTNWNYMQNRSYEETIKEEVERCKSCKTLDERLNFIETKLRVYEENKTKTFEWLKEIERENEGMNRNMRNLTDDIGKLYEEAKQNVTDLISGVEQKIVTRLHNMSDEVNLFFAKTEKENNRMNVESTENQNSTVDQNYTNLQYQITALNRRFTEQQEIISTLTNQTRKMCNLPVAFYAQVTENTITTAGEIVQYKRVLTDTCNSFNGSTSVFICTIPGVYVFHIFSLDQGNDSPNHLLLMKNTKVMSMVWSHAENGYHKTTGNSAVLELLEGDVVYVKASNKRSAQLWKDYTTFSGFMLS